MPEIKVKGMSCGHCVSAVIKAMESLPGVSNIQVELASGQVRYDSAAPVPPQDLERVIQAAGYELVN